MARTKKFTEGKATQAAVLAVLQEAESTLSLKELVSAVTAVREELVSEIVASGRSATASRTLPKTGPLSVKRAVGALERLDMVEGEWQAREGASDGSRHLLAVTVTDKGSSAEATRSEMSYQYRSQRMKRIWAGKALARQEEE